jgi:outer membrane autotransporter protein
VWGRTPWISALAFLSLAQLWGAAALAQPGPPQLSDVGNEVQQPVGAALQSICDQFVAEFGNPDAVGDLMQQDLFSRCQDVVHTANRLLANGGLTGEAIDQITGLPQLAAALQQLGTEELAAEGSNVAETSRGRILQRRLAALRAGASGVSMGRLTLDLGGTRVNAARLIGRPRGGIGSPESGTFSIPVAGLAAADSAGSGRGAETPGASGEGGLLSSRWGLFASGMIGMGEKERTPRENSFDFIVPSFVIGLDRRAADDLVWGIALGYETFDGDFEFTDTVKGGDFQSDLLSLSFYTTFYADRYYLEAIAGIGWSDLHMTREVIYPSVTRTAEADAGGQQYEATVGFGYEDRSGGTQFRPFVRMNWLRRNIDDYVESGAMGLSLHVSDYDVESLTSSVGTTLSWSISTGSGVVIPQLRGEWHHEFENDAQTIKARFVHDPYGVPFGVPTAEPDEDYFVVGAGVSGVWKRGFQAFIDFEGQVGLDHMTNYGVTVGLRFEI